MSFTTAARVKLILGIPAGVTQHDSKIDILVDFANQQILDELGLLSADQFYDETLDVETATTYALKLGRSPVISVAALTDNDTAVASADYYTANGWVKLTGTGAVFSTGRQKVDINYRAGFATIPADLKFCGDLMAVEAFNKSPHIGLESEKIGSYTYKMASQAMGPYPAEVQKILAKYRPVFS
jgi:hypothetical protein